MFLVTLRIVHSPFGRILVSVRENESRAISLGYDAAHYKFLVFVLSAGLVGVAGATKALSLQLATLVDVHWTMSGDVVLMSLIGGLGTLGGPVLGAFAMTALQNYLARFGAWVTIIQGLVFIVCVLLFREGIAGTLAAVRRRFRRSDRGALLPSP